MRGEAKTIVDFYGNTEYIGKDSYGYHNTNTDPLGGTVSIRAELEDTSRPYIRPQNYPSENINLECTNPDYMASKSSVHEMYAMSIEGDNGSSLAQSDWLRHQENIREFILLEQYRTANNKTDLLYHFQILKDNLKDSIFLVYGSGKRKIHWNLWEYSRSRYSSYEEYKRNWDVYNDRIWSRIEKDIKDDLKHSIRNLIDYKSIKKEIKRSVKKEVEKALKKNNPFRR